MKKLFCIALLTTLVSLKSIVAQTNRAEVSKIKGFYIFCDSEPVSEYEVIGEVNSSNHNDPDIQRSGAQYQPVRDYLIKKAREVNYTADGLILSLVNGQTDKAVIIKFKEGQKKKSLAKVKRFQGVYIFTDCEPLKQHNYLGTVKKKSLLFGGSLQYQPVRDRLLKMAKKKHPRANGMIVKLVSGGADTGDAIEFED